MGQILLLSTIAGLATALGGLIVSLFGRPGPRTLSVLLGGAAGIMLGVVLFDLIPSSLEYGNLLTCIEGFLLGIFFMMGLDFLLPARGPEWGNTPAHYRRMGYLVASGIALHDLPEGLAIGAGFVAEAKLGSLILLAIALHNIPEGMGTAAPLTMGNIPRYMVVLVTAIVGLVTPLGTLIGLTLLNISLRLISVFLALAGGAMAYLVGEELMPEACHLSFSRGIIGILLGLTIVLAFAGL